MPKVLNRRTDHIPPGAVYVGRPSKWGNPFTHMPVSKTAALYHCGGREEAVESYRQHITLGLGRHLLDDLDELRGKDLVCWCAPLACHADILLELANG